MACTMTTRLLGFVKNAIIAALFGATGEADVLNAVFNIPNTFRKLMAEGALSSAFIPVLSELVVRDGGPSGGHAAGRLFREVITFLLVVLVPLLALAVVFPRQGVELFTRTTSRKVATAAMVPPAAMRAASKDREESTVSIFR